MIGDLADITIDQLGERRRNHIDRIMRANEQRRETRKLWGCLLYTSDAADERSSVDLGGRRIIKKKKKLNKHVWLERRKKWKVQWGKIQQT